MTVGLALSKSTTNLQDGNFIITAFLTRRIRSLDKRRPLWP